MASKGFAGLCRASSAFLFKGRLPPVSVCFWRSTCLDRSRYSPQIARSYISTSFPRLNEKRNGEVSTEDVESKTSSSVDIDLDASEFTEEVKVNMPDMGEGEGKVLKWYKKEGDIVLREDVLCDIQTDDFVFGLQTEDEHPAIMGRILVEAPSENIKDGELLCYLLHRLEEKDK